MLEVIPLEEAEQSGDEDLVDSREHKSSHSKRNHATEHVFETSINDQRLSSKRSAGSNSEPDANLFLPNSLVTENITKGTLDGKKWKENSDLSSFNEVAGDDTKFETAGNSSSDDHSIGRRLRLAIPNVNVTSQQSAPENDITEQIHLPPSSRSSARSRSSKSSSRSIVVESENGVSLPKVVPLDTTAVTSTLPPLSPSSTSLSSSRSLTPQKHTLDNSEQISEQQLQELSSEQSLLRISSMQQSTPEEKKSTSSESGVDGDSEEEQDYQEMFFAEAVELKGAVSALQNNLALQEKLDVALQRARLAEAKAEELSQFVDQLKNSNADLKTKLLRYRKAREGERKRAQMLDQQLSATRAEMEGLLTDKRETEADRAVREARLNKVQEEVEKYKSALKEKLEVVENTVSKQEYDQLLLENKRMERQKSDMMVAIKKQQKLIDILKRQKLHMEARRQLGITEVDL